MADETYFGWHFLPADGCLAHTIPKVKVAAGDTHRHPGKIVPCKAGFHASARAIDALGYAPGPVASYVRLSGIIKHHDDDKAVASERHVFALADATATLHEFACQCAEDVIHLGGQQDIARRAIDTKRRWLKGEVSDEELAAARNAAWAATAAATAAWAATAAATAATAAWATASTTAAAAWAATTPGTAGGAAWGAAWYAAWDAARAAQDNWAAARGGQNKRLELMLFSLLGIDPDVVRSRGAGS